MRFKHSGNRKSIMTGKQCKLYDENLVRNIMISTGLSIIEYIKQCKVIDTLDVCDFIEQNAQNIIKNTIEDMNQERPDDFPDMLNDESGSGKD
jgi:hypothetical protein